MKSRKPLVAGMIVGALLTAGPFIGVVGTFLGMWRAFDVLGQSGISDPGALSGSIDTVLMTTAIGVFLGIAGLVLFTVCLILFLVRGNRPPFPPNLPPPQ